MASSLIASTCFSDHWQKASRRTPMYSPTGSSAKRDGACSRLGSVEGTSPSWANIFSTESFFTSSPQDETLFSATKTPPFSALGAADARQSQPPCQQTTLSTEGQQLQDAHRHQARPPEWQEPPPGSVVVVALPAAPPSLASSHPILRSSFSFQHDPASEGLSRPIVPNKNGFAHTVIRAWQQDLHLRLRPDDVWLAILSQFSFFVNGNAEALRPLLVAHTNRPKLVLDHPGTLETVDLGAVAQ